MPRAAAPSWKSASRPSPDADAGDIRRGGARPARLPGPASRAGQARPRQIGPLMEVDFATYQPRHFQWSLEAKVATVTLARPERKNPLTFESYAELRDTFRALAD